MPLLFGIFVVIAPYQVYLERVHRGQFQGSFWSFYPHYFEGWYGIQEGGNFAWMGIHLWYLEVLFVFSLIALPLFLALRSHTGNRLVGALSATMKVPGTIFLLAIPIAVMEFVANSPALKSAWTASLASEASAAGASCPTSPSSSSASSSPAAEKWSGPWKPIASPGFSLPSPHSPSATS